MFENITHTELVVVMLALPLTIIAYNLLGAAYANIDVKQEFSKDKLTRGLQKGFMVYAAVVIYTVISYLMADLTIDVFGGSYNLVDAVYIVIFAAIIKYAKDGILKLAEIMKYKEPTYDYDVDKQRDEQLEINWDE